MQISTHSESTDLMKGLWANCPLYVIGGSNKFVSAELGQITSKWYLYLHWLAWNPVNCMRLWWRLWNKIRMYWKYAILIDVACLLIISSDFIYFKFPAFVDFCFWMCLPLLLIFIAEMFGSNCSNCFGSMVLYKSKFLLCTSWNCIKFLPFWIL